MRTAVRWWKTSGCRHRDGSGLGASTQGRCTEGWERDGNGYPAPTARPLSPSAPPELWGSPNTSHALLSTRRSGGAAATPPWGELPPTPGGKSLLGEGTPGTARDPWGSPRLAGACWRGSRGSSRGSCWPLPCRPRAPAGARPPGRRCGTRSSCGCPPAAGRGGYRGWTGFGEASSFSCSFPAPDEVRESCCSPLPPAGPGSRGSFPSSSLTASQNFSPRLSPKRTLGGSFGTAGKLRHGGAVPAPPHPSTRPRAKAPGTPGHGDSRVLGVQPQNPRTEPRHPRACPMCSQ